MDVRLFSQAVQRLKKKNLFNVFLFLCVCVFVSMDGWVPTQTLWIFTFLSQKSFQFLTLRAAVTVYDFSHTHTHRCTHTHTHTQWQNNIKTSFTWPITVLNPVPVAVTDSCGASEWRAGNCISDCSLKGHHVVIGIFTRKDGKLGSRSQRRKRMICLGFLWS